MVFMPKLLTESQYVKLFLWFRDCTDIAAQDFNTMTILCIIDFALQPAEQIWPYRLVKQYHQTVYIGRQ